MAETKTISFDDGLRGDPAMGRLSLEEMGRFGVILADPPWRYGSPRALVGNGGRGADGGRAAAIIQADVEAHYRTMTVDEIAALPVPAADDALLFLWVTNPFLCDGSGPRVVKAWGFEPKTVLTWAKVQADGITPSMKTGHWFRSASEHVIVATRGRVPRPEDWPALPTWFACGRLPHSVKPDAVHRYAEAAYPHARRLEMFARRPRAGWDMWGNDDRAFARPPETKE